MSVHVVDLSQAFLGETQQKTNLTLRYVCDAVQESANPNTPQDKGNLRRDVLKQVLGLQARIIWDKN